MIARLDAFRRYLAGDDLDDTDNRDIPRLPAPLPHAVERVARVQLALNGAWLAGMLATLAVGGAAIVIAPFALGRAGVGVAMVSLTGWCASVVLSAVPWLAARGAARILGRDRRGLTAVIRSAWFVLLVVWPVACLAYWATSRDFALALSPSAEPVAPFIVAALVVVPVALVLVASVLAAGGVWALAVLKPYRQQLGQH